MPIIRKQGVTPPPVGGNVVSRIRGVEFKESDGFSIGLYGKTATGKTTLWASFPGKTLAIICSGTNKPGELRSLNKEQRARTKTVRVESSDEVLELCEYLANGAGYDNAVLDHASALQSLVLKEVLGLPDAPTKVNWGDATQGQYGTVATKMIHTLKKFLCVPGRRIVVAQERIFNDRQEGESEIISPSIGFGLLPSVAGFLGPECDYVMETFIRPKKRMSTIIINKKPKQIEVVVPNEYEYCVRSGPDSLYTTKFRAPKGTEIPRIFVDPTYDTLIPYIKG